MKCLYFDILDEEVYCFNDCKSKRDCRGCEIREDALWEMKEKRKVTTGDVTNDVQDSIFRTEKQGVLEED